jgi:methionyl-tRNA synthetase
MPKKFYLTTPIYYVNARPHIGHAYTTIAADVLARRHRLLGEDVFFLTGTDEHGQKIERSAAAAGVPPQQFADEVAASFKALWKRMGITNDKFIRTTSAEHKLGVQKLFRRLQETGAIYLDSYTGAYCVSDETFVDLPAGTPCPDCGRPLEIVTEENYFFRLSAYQEKLIELIESGTLNVEPEARRNEVLSFVRGGLKDLSISRTSFKWGIPVPNDERHVVYVWLDALANYMTAVGYGSDAPEDIASFEKYWPADLHLVGKEIIRFHCVYWPAFLLAAGLPLPKKIQAHGWLLFEESKMSKSRGNIVRTETILDAFGEHYRKELTRLGRPEPDKRDSDLFAADVLRYFLLREIPFGQDGSFSFDALITRYNADLANGYGNLVSRTLKLIETGLGGSVHQIHPMGFAVGPDPTSRHTWTLGVSPFPDEVWDASPTLEQAFSLLVASSNISQSLELLTQAIGEVDGFLSEEAPWKIAKEPSEKNLQRLNAVLYGAAESIRIITALLYPVMPHTTAKVWAQLGLGDIDEAARKGKLKDLKWGGLTPGTKLGVLAPIFPRAPKELAQVMADMETQNNPATPKYGDSGRAQGGVQNDASGRVAAAAPQPSAAPAPSSVKSVESVSSVLGSSPAGVSSSPGAGTNSPQISIDDFAKVDLRVARVLVAERIPKADKLLRLEVDLGYEKRQILAGIAQFYEPEKLVGRKVVIVANLAPRKMRGLESQGMVVAASVGDGPPALASFLEDVEIGARLK